MAVVKDRDAMDCLDAIDLGFQRGVIGRMEVAQSRGDVIGGRFGTGLPYRLAVEIAVGNEAGRVLARIEACARRVTVRIDDIAMEGRPHHRRIGSRPS